MNVSEAVSFDYSRESIRLAYAKSGGAETLSLESASESFSFDSRVDAYDPDGPKGLAASLATPEGVTAFLEEKVLGRVKARFEEALGPGKVPDPFDRSPEATAGRIVRFATGFYEQYAEQNGDSRRTLEDFLGIVEGAIGEGFAQAVAVIGSEPGEVSRTRDLIKEYLASFKEDRLLRLEERETPSEKRTAA